SDGGSPAATLAAAGTFRTGSSTPEGNRISLGAMLRLEVDPPNGMFRVSVRAVHATVTLALCNVLRSQLGG
ncbi:unnamed protein product, partial [Laminaria digitata]